MQATKNKASKAAKRVPQISGGRYGKGVQGIRSANGRRRVPKSAAGIAAGAAEPFALKPIAKTICMLDVEVLQEENNHFAHPHIQLEMIENIYPIVAKMKGYRDSKKLTENSSPGQVLNHILSEFDRLTDLGDDDGFEEGAYKIAKNSKGKWSIKTRSHYGSRDAQWITMGFLSKIRESHAKLHDLLLYSFMLASKINGVGLPFDWVKMEKRTGHHGMTYEYLLEREADIDEPEQMQKWLDYYGPEGVPAAYCRLMKTGASYRFWKARLDKFQPVNALEKKSMEYLAIADQLFQTKMSIHPLCNNPYGEGITPRDYMQIVWSTDDDDWMWMMHCEVTDDFFNSFGAYPFTWERDFSDPTDDQKLRDFCDLFRKFFTEGCWLSHWMTDQLKDKPEINPSKKKTNKNAYLINILS